MTKKFHDNIISLQLSGLTYEREKESNAGRQFAKIFLGKTWVRQPSFSFPKIFIKALF